MNVPKAATTPQLTVITKPSPTTTTEVYDTYWHFAVKRQNVFFKRLEQENGPWSEDPILQQYKFTNAYRSADRVSQYLIRNVIYDGEERNHSQTFFRILLFKFFNKIETWKLLERHIGSIHYYLGFIDRFDYVLSKAMAEGRRIYSAAYIMPSGGSLNQSGRKHKMHLELLDRMMRDDLPTKLAHAQSMKEAFCLLRSYPTIGDFLAYQYITDINYSNLINFNENDFVIPGPGALSGITKCFVNTGDRENADIIRHVTDTQQEEFEKRGLKFKDLWGRKLHLIDCQNLFCEVDKYARVAHPHRSTGRVRIKQKFAPTSDRISYFFPPKWSINANIPSQLQFHDSLL